MLPALIMYAAFRVSGEMLTWLLPFIRLGQDTGMVPTVYALLLSAVKHVGAPDQVRVNKGL